jgi:hypothetical protein
MATAKRPKSRTKKKRTKRVTFAFTEEDLELMDRAAERALETRGKWGYRRLVFAARTELGLSDGEKKP